LEENIVWVENVASQAQIHLSGSEPMPFKEIALQPLSDWP